MQNCTVLHSLNATFFGEKRKRYKCFEPKIKKKIECLKCSTMIKKRTKKNLFFAQCDMTRYSGPIRNHKVLMASLSVLDQKSRKKIKSLKCTKNDF